MNKIMDKYIIRELESSDCEDVMVIWSMAHFVLFKYSNQIMLKTDPKCILVAQDHDSGKLLGIISGINLSPDLAFIGQYAVREECRGLGIGSALWQRIMDNIGSERNIALSSVQNMNQKYRDIGFKFDAQKNVIFYSGKPNLDQMTKRIEGISVFPINDDNIEKVVQYDREVCGIDRKLFIDEKRKYADTITSVAFNDSQEVVGYAMIGVSNEGKALIEPLYANDRQTAELLVSTVCESTTIALEVGLVYTVWHINKESVEIAQKLGLEFKSEEQLLFTKRIVEPNCAQRIFCLSSTTFYPF